MLGDKIIEMIDEYEIEIKDLIGGEVSEMDIVIMYPEIVQRIEKSKITYDITYEVIKSGRKDLIRYLPEEYVDRIIDKNPEIVI